MPHWPKILRTNYKDIDLVNIKALLDRLGNPERKIKNVVHVAGTNGKGSTIAFLHAILIAAGYKVNKYISPHLIRFNERITLMNKEVEDNILYSALEECRNKADGLDLTFFEATTAAAFLLFSNADADISFIETGMGGRLDATNVICNPLISVITPISYDHCEYLGSTLISIAKEKAGIIKKNSKCVISWQEREVKDFLIKKAEELCSQSHVFGRDWNLRKNEQGFSYIDSEELNLPKPSLVGIHQTLNAATAIATTKKLNFSISNNQMVEGIKNAYWPARMQRITKGVLYAMLPESYELWLDGAHNPSGAQMVAATLLNMAKMKTIMINGRSKGRDIKGFLVHFKDIIELLYAVKVQWEPMSEDPEKIVDVAKEIGFKASVMPSIKDALNECIKLHGNTPVRILVVGSLYFAGDVMTANQE